MSRSERGFGGASVVVYLEADAEVFLKPAVDVRAGDVESGKMG